MMLPETISPAEQELNRVSFNEENEHVEDENHKGDEMAKATSQRRLGSNPRPLLRPKEINRRAISTAGLGMKEEGPSNVTNATSRLDKSQLRRWKSDAPPIAATKNPAPYRPRILTADQEYYFYSSRDVNWSHQRRHEHEAELLLQRAFQEEAARQQQTSSPLFRNNGTFADTPTMTQQQQQQQSPESSSFLVSPTPTPASTVTMDTPMTTTSIQPESENVNCTTAMEKNQDQLREPDNSTPNPRPENDELLKDLANVSAVDRLLAVPTVLFGRIGGRNKAKAKAKKQEEGVVASPTEQGHQEEEEDDDDEDKDSNPQDDGMNHSHSWKPLQKLRASKPLFRAFHAGKEELHSLADFFKPKQRGFFQTIVFVGLAILIPCTAVSFVLFQWFGNPPTGRCNANNLCTANVPSTSWWILFLGVRQVLLWLWAKGMDVFFIDWFILQHPAVVRLLGPHLCLIIIQSKGWPSVMFWWAILDFCLLYGRSDFSDHWLYWQKAIPLFNNENPAGTVLQDESYRNILITMLCLASAVSLKRHFLGLHLGKRLYVRFNERLTVTMKEITAISELALWVRRRRDQGATYSEWSSSNMKRTASANSIVEKGQRSKKRLSSLMSKLRPSSLLSRQDDSTSTTFASVTTDSDDIKNSNRHIDHVALLEAWEEPKTAETGEDVSGHSIIEFKQAFAVMTKPFFFSSAFGPVESRAECYHSADRLFRRMLKLFPGEEEKETMMMISLQKLTRWMFEEQHCRSEKEAEEAAAHLSILLNPDGDNLLNIVDFVRGIDEVYKKVRLLENAVHNASHIDRSYEKVINVLFYFVVICIVLIVFGRNPIKFLLSISSLIVAFSFMIGPGSAAFFEGVVMVLGRQPFDIGDRIAISIPNSPPDFDGSPQWLVESIDLVTTNARLTATGELASFSNGSLARCRIINAKRSPNPTVYVMVKFGTDIPYSTIMVFRSAVKKFVDDRPQEWVGMTGFRPGRIEAQMNFVEYTIALQHKLSWQSLVPIKESRAAVASFCVEIQKQLGCRYIAPPMPVEIKFANARPNFDDLADFDGNNPVDPEGMQRETSLEVLMESAKQFEAKKND